MTTTLVNPDLTCPYCGEKIGEATGIEEDKTPKPGDVSICFFCGAILIFTKMPDDSHLSIRKPSLSEITSITLQFPEVTRLQKDIRKQNEKHLD